VLKWPGWPGVDSASLHDGQTMSEESLTTGYKKLRTDTTGII